MIDSLQTCPYTAEEKYFYILIEQSGKIKKAQIDKARIQFIRDVEAWRNRIAEGYAKELNALPHTDIDDFWVKFNSEDSQIAKWSKEDSFNSFMMGYFLAIREFMFGPKKYTDEERITILQKRDTSCSESGEGDRK